VTLVVVTCMDPRIDPLDGFGLALGDVAVLRNAGAEVTDDVVRSVRLAHEALGSEEAWLVAHSDCAANERDDSRALASLRRSVAALRSALGDRVKVRPFFYDLSARTLEPVPEETA
jgi:carbonic anhydrase